MASFEDIVKMMKEGKIKKKNKQRTKFGVDGDDPHPRGKKELTPEQLRLIQRQRDADERSRQRRDEELRQRRRAAIEREKERKAHRKAQQEERERLAMLDSFEDPEADEEYDGYAFGFGDEDSVKLRF